MKYAFMFLVMLTACSTTNNYIVSRNIVIDRAEYDSAWSRTNAYIIQRNYIETNAMIVPDKNHALMYDIFIITREFDKTSARLRVTSCFTMTFDSGFDTKYHERRFNRKMEYINDFCNDYFNYVRTGTSNYVKDFTANMNINQVEKNESKGSRFP